MTELVDSSQGAMQKAKSVHLKLTDKTADSATSRTGRPQWTWLSTRTATAPVR
ncbi:hypothetical protein [Streptomyces sp. NPDC058086]|uniref:hypothetical protein n=1 Tax=Streptomyces sp. NPDC058086 TaxID=3346334 RepID=UPI0036E7AEBD